jgi:hypothetical protein
MELEFTHSSFTAFLSWLIDEHAWTEEIAMFHHQDTVRLIW